MFIKDCNTCWCNEDGTSYFCTRRICIEEKSDETPREVTPEDLRIIKKQCKPDEVLEMNCNMCRCNSDGQSYSCTRRACIEMPDGQKNLTLSRKVRASQQDTPKACQPRQEFRMDCNKCLCDNDGQDFSCTRIDCNAVNNQIHNGGFAQPRSKRSRPGASMALNQPSPSPGRVRPKQHEKEETSGNTSRQKRDTTEKENAGCKPGELFARGCNMCRCSEDGKLATCTLKHCPNQNEGEKDQQLTGRLGPELQV